MPITSHQVGGYIGGQQAMFGNFASYAQQISPGYGGPPPAYSNPMGGVSGFEAPPPPGSVGFGTPGYEQVGAGAMSAIGNVGLPAAAGAMMLGGAFMPGAVGGFFRGIDPFSRGLSAMGKGLGWQGGGLAGLGGNLSRAASLGAGGIARAGLMGLGSAAITALPLMAVGGALKYGIGQMVEGAQFQNQVGGFLQNQFRFSNPASESGYGFGQMERQNIGNMLREMGTQEMISTPQEMLRIMKQGVGMGLFTAVRDAKEFRTRFQNMVSVAKEVAQTMSTTLEGAMPFIREARRMGFWTPQDVMKQAGETRATAATTGLSVAQTQAMMFQGAQMARQIGARGATGALGMQRTMNLVGGMMRSGVVSQEELAEATGGLEGPEAVQALSQQSMAATARFAASGRGRWVLAGLAQRNMQGFDPGRLRQFLSGNMSIGQLGGLARQNVGGGNAFNFVMNEQNLRGQLMQQGPEAQHGFVRSILGERLFDESARGQYITRRLMQRYFGVDARLADVMAKQAREAPRIMQEHQARASAQADQLARTQERALEQGWEGVKRDMGKWWERAVSEPLQQWGASIAQSISDVYQRASDRLFSRVATRNRYQGVSASESLAMQRYALGDTQAMNVAFGREGPRATTDMRLVATGLTGAVKRFFADDPTSGIGAWMRATGRGPEQQFSQQQAAALQMMLGGRSTEEGARALGFKSMEDSRQQRKDLTEQMTSLLQSPQVVALREQIGHRGGVGGYGEEVVRMIRSGRVSVGEGIKQLVMGGSEREAAQRLAAMQRGQHRQLTTAIDAAAGMEGFKLMGGAALSLEQAERNLQEQEKTLAGSLTKKVRAGSSLAEDLSAGATGGLMGIAGGLFKWGTRDVSPEDIGRLRQAKGKSGSFEDAAKYAAEAQALEAEAAKGGPGSDEKRADARRLTKLSDQILADISSSQDATPEVRKHANALRQMDKDERIQAMGSMGRALQDVSKYGFIREVVDRRMGRARGELGGKIVTVSRLGEELVGGGRDVVGALLRGGQDPRQRHRLLEELTTAAAQDPKKAAKILELVGGVSGAEDIAAALGGGAMGEGAHRIATGRGRAGTGDLTTMLEGLGVRGTGVDIRKLRGAGAEKEITRILSGMSKAGAGAEAQKPVEELLRAVSRGEAGEADIRRLGTSGIMRRIARGYGAEGDIAKDIRTRIQEGGAKPMGAMGSPEGMHKEMIMQSQLLRSLESAMVHLAKKGGYEGSSLTPAPSQGKTTEGTK